MVSAVGVLPSFVSLAPSLNEAVFPSFLSLAPGQNEVVWGVPETLGQVNALINAMLVFLIFIAPLSERFRPLNDTVLGPLFITMINDPACDKPKCELDGEPFEP